MNEASPVRRGEMTARSSWIGMRPGLPYFVTEEGRSWTPIGQNDAITWPELAGLFQRRDLPAVERHLRWLKASGVTCLRLMLEYNQVEHRYFEKPAGYFVPAMVRLWDDLFRMLEDIGLCVLLTPFDTFFLWRRWRKHPYNRANGGPCADRRDLLLCPETRTVIKRRLGFASDRWGGSPALFAWDIWNEMHPSYGRDDPANVWPFISDVGDWLRARETARYGRAHLQTASMFGPRLIDHPELIEPIFHHPALDFANTHLYEEGTIDDPADTVAPARAVGRLMRSAVRDAHDNRPVFDSEHGPIHTFKDKHHTLPEAFDDEYFRHMQWAHLASGGAGGGMRWPNRHPHVLTPGMRAAQRAMADFLPLIDWTRFRRRNLNEEVEVSGAKVACFACGDAEQALLWLLRDEGFLPDGRLDPDLPAQEVRVGVPEMRAGSYRVTLYDTKRGAIVVRWRLEQTAAGRLDLPPIPLGADITIAIQARGRAGE